MIAWCTKCGDAILRGTDCVRDLANDGFRHRSCAYHISFEEVMKALTSGEAPSGLDSRDVAQAATEQTINAPTHNQGEAE
jgi:hypothetical protein